MFIGYETSEDGIAIMVREGTHKPYFLSEKGLKPTGVYVRQAASSVPASFDQIREMIKLTDSDKFETARSLKQELTFDVTTQGFSRRGVEFGPNQMRTLGIIGEDSLYTNLRMLLSDQCTHTIKFAVFSGTKKGEFKTRKEITGSVPSQMHSAFDLLIPPLPSLGSTGSSSTITRTTKSLTEADLYRCFSAIISIYRPRRPIAACNTVKSRAQIN